MARTTGDPTKYALSDMAVAAIRRVKRMPHSDLVKLLTSAGIGPSQACSRIRTWLQCGCIVVVVPHEVAKLRVYGAPPPVESTIVNDPEALRKVLTVLARRDMSKETVVTITGLDTKRVSKLLELWMAQEWICPCALGYTVGPRWLRERVEKQLDAALSGAGNKSKHKEQKTWQAD